MKKKRNFYLTCLFFMLPVFSQSIIEAMIYSINLFYSFPKFGEEALAAFNVANIIWNFFFFLALSVSIAGNISFSKYFKEKKWKKCQENFAIQIITFFIIITVVVITIKVLSEKIITFLLEMNKENITHKELFRKYTESYLSKAIYFFIFACFSLIFYNVCFISRKIKTSLKISIFTFFVSLISAFFFFLSQGKKQLDIDSFENLCWIIFISRYFEFIIVTSYLIFKKPFFFSIQKKVWKNAFFKIKRFFWFLFPILINELQFAVFLIAQPLLLFVGGGEKVLNAFDFNLGLMYFFYSVFPACSILIYKFIPSWRTTNEKEIIIKNNKKEKKIILLVFLIGILFFLIGFISSEFIAFFLEKLTTKLDSETLELTKTYIKWQSFALPFQILTVTIYAILRVKKFIKTVLILDGLYLWVIITGGIWFFFNKEKLLDEKTVIIYISLAEILSTMIAYSAYYLLVIRKQNSWKKVSYNEQEKLMSR